MVAASRGLSRRRDLPGRMLRPELPGWWRVSVMFAGPAQAAILLELARFLGHHGFSPTWRQLAVVRGGVRTNAINDVLARLERRGLIRRRAGKLMHRPPYTITPLGNQALGLSADATHPRITPIDMRCRRCDRRVLHFSIGVTLLPVFSVSWIAAPHSCSGIICS